MSSAPRPVLHSSPTSSVDGEGTNRPRRRASRNVRLVLIGAASLAACSDPVDTQTAQRDVYEHRSQCVQDWNDEKKCELVTQGPHRGYWYGPGYVGARFAPGSTSQRVGVTNEPMRGKQGSSSTRVARSGFGSSSSFRSSGS